MKKPLTYSASGVRYSDIDPVKKYAQEAAKATGRHLRSHSFVEVSDSRGESAYVWKQGSTYMASVVEGLGTKNLVADAVRKFTKKTHYDAIANDTVASIINDLVSVGASPLTLHAYWAVGSGEWLTDTRRMLDLISGWKKACDKAGVSWGGGETPVLKGIIADSTIDLGGSAVGIIKNKKQLLTDKNIKAGDRILFVKSNGINMNGLSLARALAKRLPKGYASKMPNKKTYGEALLKPANIYARLVQDLFKAQVPVHYISNITGHGLRKVMRARQQFTYRIEKVFAPQTEFAFIQKNAGLSDYEMYQTFNMGQDYAIFLPAAYLKKALAVVRKSGFVGIDAGVVEKGKKRVCIEPKNIVFEGETLDLR